MFSIFSDTLEVFTKFINVGDTLNSTRDKNEH